MAKNDAVVVEQTAGSAPAPEVATDFPLTLQEFCSRVSLKDRRVELIGGFEHTERAAGRIKDTDANFSKRFAAYATKPA